MQIVSLLCTAHNYIAVAIISIRATTMNELGPMYNKLSETTKHKIRNHNSNRKKFPEPGNFSHLTASFAWGVATLASRKSKRGFTFLAFRRVFLFTLYRLLITLSTSYAYCKSRRRGYKNFRRLLFVDVSFFIPFMFFALVWMNLPFMMIIICFSRLLPCLCNEAKTWCDRSNIIEVFARAILSFHSNTFVS